MGLYQIKKLCTAKETINNVRILGYGLYNALTAKGDIHSTDVKQLVTKLTVF